eukprot:scaffold2752_cov393-Prasinococcus_capsulatus_cf.AAC.3
MPGSMTLHLPTRFPRLELTPSPHVSSSGRSSLTFNDNCIVLTPDLFAWPGRRSLSACLSTLRFGVLGGGPACAIPTTSRTWAARSSDSGSCSCCASSWSDVQARRGSSKHRGCSPSMKSSRWADNWLSSTRGVEALHWPLEVSACSAEEASGKSPLASSARTKDWPPCSDGGEGAGLASSFLLSW